MYQNIIPACYLSKERFSESLKVYLISFSISSNAVFTPGAYINNRSLMPCQEPPVAMSTWQAYFHVKNGETVLMSGDHCVCKESLFRELYNEPGMNKYYKNTKVVMKQQIIDMHMLLC